MPDQVIDHVYQFDFSIAILAKDSICDHPFSFPSPSRPEGDHSWGGVV